MVAVTRGFSPSMHALSPEKDHEAISAAVGTRLFPSWCRLWRTWNPELCLGGRKSDRLPGFRFGRYDDGIFGLLGGRQKLPLATFADPLVVRGNNISAMASARPRHHVWD